MAWEVKLAKRVLGDENVVELPSSRIPANFLPASVRGFDDAGEFSVQVKACVERARQTDRPLKIAILNGFGTMLGDTALGVGAFSVFFTANGIAGYFCRSNRVSGLERAPRYSEFVESLSNTE